MSYQYAVSYATPKDENTVTKFWNRLVRQSQHDAKGRPRTKLAIIRRRLLRVPTALILLWVFVLHWGERSAFSSSIEACEWDKWEKWPSNAQPHRVVMIADPQLVDPHTYPGRPWPLSALTIKATDKYIKRSYRLIQRDIDPDTVFFLGDLFDGGREWSTHHTGFQASEQQWERYGDTYWLNEYDRFGKIFFEQDQLTGGLTTQKIKKLIASLPGNHDLGFGNGVQVPVRNRFQAYFGEGDRIDVLGNHTFVSLDTVSLSAMGQPDSPPELWNSTMLFLDQAKELKHKAVRTDLRLQQGLLPNRKYAHKVTHPRDLGRQPAKADVAKESNPEFPTIVLSHVPLYRDPGTPCGPLREKYPPHHLNLEYDEPNAIRVAAGYQYQNVLTREISAGIADKIGNVAYAFSGDDHDYCELVHRGYSSAGGRGIREITVKSISWAMGVRKPGFQLVSLWNPVDKAGNPLRSATEPTLKTHICLLPDQLGIFIRYAVVAVFSLATVAVYSVIQTKKESTTAVSDSVLPTTEPAKAKSATLKQRSRAPSGATNSMSSEAAKGRLMARSTNARTRSVSPAASMGYGLPTARPSGPLIEKAGYYGGNPEYQMYNKEDRDETDEWGNPFLERKPPKPRSFGRRLVDRFGMEVAWVAIPVFSLYYWLLKHG